MGESQEGAISIAAGQSREESKKLASQGGGGGGKEREKKKIAPALGGGEYQPKNHPKATSAVSGKRRLRMKKGGRRWGGKVHYDGCLKSQNKKKTNAGKGVVLLKKGNPLA